MVCILPGQNRNPHRLVVQQLDPASGGTTTRPLQPSGTQIHFTDVPTGNWAENYIYDIAAKGWMLGTERK